MSPLKVFKSTCSHPAHLFNTSLGQFFPRNNGAPAPLCVLRLAEEHRNRKRQGAETQAHNIEPRRRWQLAAATELTAVLVPQYCLILNKPSRGKLCLQLISYSRTELSLKSFGKGDNEGSYCEKNVLLKCVQTCD